MKSYTVAQHIQETKAITVMGRKQPKGHRVGPLVFRKPQGTSEEPTTPGTQALRQSITFTLEFWRLKSKSWWHR